MYFANVNIIQIRDTHVTFFKWKMLFRLRKNKQFNECSNSSGHVITLKINQNIK